MHRNTCYHLLLLLLLSAACKKPATPAPTQPLMRYTELQNRTVRYQAPAVAIDVNNDQVTDLVFGVMRVGDPLYRVDKIKYMVSSSIYTALPVNPNEEVPAMATHTLIPLSDFGNHNWYPVVQVALTEHHIFEQDRQEWIGNWLGAQRKYLPFYQLQNGLRYAGWIEVSDDRQQGQLVLHRMAISTVGEQSIRAGQ